MENNMNIYIYIYIYTHMKHFTVHQKHNIANQLYVNKIKFQKSLKIFLKIIK